MINKLFLIHTREWDCRGHLGLDPFTVAITNHDEILRTQISLVLIIDGWTDVSGNDIYDFILLYGVWLNKNMDCVSLSPKGYTNVFLLQEVDNTAAELLVEWDQI